MGKCLSVTKIRESRRRVPCDLAAKLPAMEVLVAEIQQKLAQMALEAVLMIPEPLQHPYEVFVKAEMKILQLVVQTAIFELGFPEKGLVVLYG